MVCFLRAGMAQERKTFGQPSRTVEQLAVELGAGATLEDLKDYVSSQHIAHEQKKSTLHLDELAYSRLLAALFPAGAVRWARLVCLCGVWLGATVVCTCRACRTAEFVWFAA